MDGRASIISDLEDVERLIADASGRAVDLENAVSVMRALQGDTTAADSALLATYHALGLFTRRRATLLKMLEGYDGDRDG